MLSSPERPRGSGRASSARSRKWGARGIVLAQRGAAKGEAEAAFLRETYGIDAVSMKVDVTRADQVNAMIVAALARFGRVDILVNNAGASVVKRLEAFSDEEMEAAFALNYLSAFHAMRAVFPAMKAQNYGRIINMGSLNGVNAHRYTAGYNASKEALRALSRTAAVEWGEHGIAVGIICPAALSPAAKSYIESDPDMMGRLLEQIPAGRFGEARDGIAPVAVFLASDAAGYASGNTVFVSGASHINGISWRPHVND